MDSLTKIKFRTQNLIRFIFIEHFNPIVCLLTLAIAGVLVYRNALGAPFIFDDLTQILQNPNIQSWQWPWTFIENNRRPLLYATLAFNFHFDGFNAIGYHIFNIRVHIVTAMVLFLLVRKTLGLPSGGELFRKDADLLALASSLVWLLHPIHTQAVTYIIQRAESLMGLFFLTALYCSSEYLSSRRKSWLICAGGSALLAGLTKEVALVLPVMVLLYDRTFISASFRAAIQKNRWLYSVISLTWGVMIFLYLTTRPEEKLTAGFGMAGMTPWLYAVNQPAVILHYLRLILWPVPLVFDYQWPAVSQLRLLLPSLCVVMLMVLVLGAMYRRFRVLSFLGLSFFILLLPSSSIIPLKDLIFEYRLYLSLSCVAVAVALGLRLFVERFVSQRDRKAFFILVVAIVSLILGGVTYQRNKVYLSEESIWLDVIKKQPTNARAYNNLGEYWLRLGRDSAAKKCFLNSIALDTSYADVYANMATVLGKEGKVEQAIQYAQQAIVVNPDFAVGYNNLGSALSQIGRYAEAVPYFEKALALGFVREGVLINLAVALHNSGQPQKAVKVLKDALVFNPASSEVPALLKEVLDKMKHY
jgi:Tfp pilus assembly protein PilF